MSKLVYGKGINDSEGQVSWKIDGKTKWCPFYVKWTSMLKRCYNPKWIEQNQSYIGCTVCEEWLYFSNFKKWMETQDWVGKNLDKDLLSNLKMYSPETCVFIDVKLNSYLTLSTHSRGTFPIGVTESPTAGKYRTHISGKQLGTFKTILDAHKAWQREKLSQAYMYQESSISTRIKDGIQRIINVLEEDLSTDRITVHF